MHRALLDIDPLTGIRQYFGWDNEGNEYLVDEVDKSDVQAVLDHNKQLNNHADLKRGDMWHVATIPAWVQYEWVDKHGVRFWDPNHKDGVKRLLNSSDYRWLKTQDIIL